MGRPLDATVEEAQSEFINRGQIGKLTKLYSDLVMYLYLAEHNPEKFRQTALYIDSPKDYLGILEKYRGLLRKLDFDTKGDILMNLRETADDHPVHFSWNYDLYMERRQELYSMASYFWQNFIVVHSNPVFFGTRSNPRKSNLSIIKGNKIAR